MGVPQGSILSVTLFCLKISSIIKAVCPDVDYSVYVDDFLICYCSKHIHIIERHLQRCPISYRNGLTPMGLSSLPPRLYAFIFVVSVMSPGPTASLEWQPYSSHRGSEIPGHNFSHFSAHVRCGQTA